jgi:hypothetical protein
LLYEGKSSQMTFGQFVVKGRVDSIEFAIGISGGN